MKNLLLIFFLFNFKVVKSQKAIKDEISKYVLDRYKSDSADFKQTNIDTIINLLNGNYFCLVKTEIDDSNAESGFFDCYELSVNENKIVIKNSILNVSNNTGGSGDCEINYDLYYLDSANYLLIVIKNLVHSGIYSTLYSIINSKTIILEKEILNDWLGHLEFYDFNKSIVAIKKRKFVTGFYFISREMVSISPPTYSVVEKKYKVANFNSITSRFKTVALIKQSKNVVTLK